MKYVIASDLHGSVKYTYQLVERIHYEKPEKIILLGDLYYHGPRNPMELGYYPMGVADVLNEMADKLIVVRGNCDADIDMTISNFKFEDERLIDADGLKVFLTHGHLHDETYLPTEEFDIMLHGHSHYAYIEKIGGGRVCANPGSITSPKDGKRCYLVLDNGRITLKSLDDGSGLDSLDCVEYKKSFEI